MGTWDILLFDQFALGLKYTYNNLSVISIFGTRVFW